MTADSRPPLYILAFDHRVSLIKMFGENGGTYNGQRVDFSGLKEIIFDALLASLAPLGLKHSDVGILVDEECGSDIAFKARELGVILAMPAERSMQKVFELEYGDKFDEHIEKFDPDQVKVLAIRDDSIDAESRALSKTRLKALSDWLKPRRQKFMLELLVFPTPAQLASVGGSQERFDTELRPSMMVETIAEYQDAGIEADVWKVEGLKSVEHYADVAKQAQAGGRDHVECIILGRGAPEPVIEEWIRTAAEVPGFTGFAIGRSTWADSLKAVMDGTITRDQAVQEIAGRFSSYVRMFKGGRV
jgi:myo-inositol catabolism protein IolC